MTRGGGWPPSRFDMADDGCGELFNAVTHVIRKQVGHLPFTARKRIAAAMFDQPKEVNRARGKA